MEKTTGFKKISDNHYSITSKESLELALEDYYNNEFVKLGIPIYFYDFRSKLVIISNVKSKVMRHMTTRHKSYYMTCRHNIKDSFLANNLETDIKFNMTRIQNGTIFENKLV